jgi:DNA (cytosine-5)-methyltransferase 1
MDTIRLDRQLKVLDLFCGAGGLSLGFERADYRVKYGVDNYEKALNTWEINHDSGISHNKNLETVDPDDLIKKFEEDIDIVVGGPPCKDFSKTNQKVDLGRNNLVLVFAEYVSKIEPEAFVMENVRQLTTKYDDVLEDFIDELEDEYNISYRLLDAADYGVPQHRIRAFVIGIKNRNRDSFPDPVFPRPSHGPDSNSDRELVSAGDVINDIEEPTKPEEYHSNSKHAHLLEDIPPGMNYSFYTERMGHPEPKFDWRSRFSDYLYKADPEKPVRTLKAKPGAASGPFHWNNRRFTEAELKRLQSFPDDFEFSTESHTHITRMIGNSVPPAQSYAIANVLKKQINCDFNTLTSDRKLDFNSRRRTSTEEYEKKAEERIEQLYDK